jgi:hypothetical protein
VTAPRIVSSSISYDFESGAAGWTTGASDGTPPVNWELGDPTTRSPLDGGNCSADCHGNGGPDDDHTPDAGTTAWGTDLDDLYPNNVGGIYLYSPVFDLSGKTNVQLSFWEWLEIEALTWDQARLEYSVNGGVWTVIFQTVDTPTRLDSAWSQFTHDASSYADDQPQVQWRWSLDSDTAWQAAGWYIDDIEISFDSVDIVTQPAGDPPHFFTAADGYSLSPGETMTLTFLATVDDPISTSHITNTAAVSSIQATVPVTDDVVNLTNIAPESPPYRHRCRRRHSDDYICD